MSDALVLVVDDDAANRASVLKSLEREGLRVLAAAEGREALAVLRRERVAVLLTDLMMPGVDGLELLKARLAAKDCFEDAMRPVYVAVLTSPEFRIERKFLAFLIGGGKNPEKLAVQLLIEGKVVRSATGPNDRSGGSEALAQNAIAVLAPGEVKLRGGEGFVEFRELFGVGLVDFEVAQLQPLAGEILHERAAPAVVQHPPHLRLEVLAQQIFLRERGQLFIRHRAPEEVT